MSANWSHLSSNWSSSPQDCFASGKSFLILTGFSMANTLLVLPLSVLVLCLGCQRWRQQRGSSAAAANHSDIFTYHMAVMEVFVVVFSLLFCASVTASLPSLGTYVFNVFFCLWSIKIIFHALTSAELYLAVVHPVAYLSLRTEGGTRVRCISVACVWLLCFVWGAVISTSSVALVSLYFSFLAFAMVVVCFSCVSVLWALRRPGPGEAVGDRQRVDQMKHRAFTTVASIMAALWLCLGGTLLCNVVASLNILSESDSCAALASSAWFSLPSSSVLPVLYLHRAGKLPCCTYA